MLACLVSVIVNVAVDVIVVVVVAVAAAVVVDSLLSFELNMLTVLVVDLDLGCCLAGVLQDGSGGHRLGDRGLHPGSGYRSRTGGPRVRIDVHRDGCGETLLLLRSGGPLKIVVRLTRTCPT